ncbi:MAG TPA: hypothetical protein DDZ51_25225 [Planctomycetaceae bacterium]|nr:hypothetical protein [Planctomycetaceae bacterium]
MVLSMKIKLAILIGLSLGLSVTALSWSYQAGRQHVSEPLIVDALVPGKVWAYRIPFPFTNFDSAALEIRRSSTANDLSSAVNAPGSGLHMSLKDAEMVVSTGRLISTGLEKGISVAAWVFEVDEIIADATELEHLSVAGSINAQGLVSRIIPKANFLCGDSLAASWEKSPRWVGNEICVGKFRTHDEDRVYEYHCVVVASDSAKR